MLIGPQLRTVLGDLEGPLSPVRIAVAVVATVIAARIVRVFPATYLPRLPRPRGSALATRTRMATHVAVLAVGRDARRRVAGGRARVAR